MIPIEPGQVMLPREKEIVVTSKNHTGNPWPVDIEIKIQYHPSMRDFLFASLFTLASAHSFSQHMITGRVLNASNYTAIENVEIIVVEKDKKTTTDSNGEFTFKNLAEGTYTIHFIHHQFESVTEILTLNGDITGWVCEMFEIREIQIRETAERLTDGDSLREVLIEATRADSRTPVALTEVSQKHIARLNNGQDMPYLLRFTPSLVATSDAGNGVGYTGLWIRGSDPSRINVSINGIPLNDPESQQVFWVNTPDLGSSADNVQVQRGIGTSANGAASFGGSIKIDTRAVRTAPYAELSSSIGSFATAKNSIAFGTGLKGPYSFEGRFSHIASDGYIDRATSNLRSYFLEANYLSNHSQIKLLGFGGRERTYQSWYGTPWEVLYGSTSDQLDFALRNGLSDAQTENLTGSGRTYNYYQYKNQVDNYGQDHAQFHYTHYFSNYLSLHLSTHYTHGRGYFEEWKENQAYEDYGLENVIVGNDTLMFTNLVRRRWLKNDFLGEIFSMIYTRGNWESVIGGAINEYRGQHFGELTWMQHAGNTQPDEEYYRGKSLKRDGNIYLRNTFSPVKWIDLYTDLQLRGVSYQTSGTDNNLRVYDIQDKLFFFNPKAGINARINKGQRLYLSAAIGAKEPNRNDYVDAADAKTVKPERLTDFEAGYQLDKTTASVWCNLYHMLYKDQLVLTGEVNDVGAPLRTNVAESYRQGIEAGGTWNFHRHFNLNGNFTLSRNKIKKFEEVLYDYTTEFDVVNITHENKTISFAPSVISAAQLSYQFESITKNDKKIFWELSYMAKYVGKQFMDNTENEATALPAYLVTDLLARIEFPSVSSGTICLNFTINNALDAHYSSNGYTYSYVYEKRITERFYYPQAGRSFNAALVWKM